MRQDGDLDNKEMIRIIVAVIVVALGIFYGVVNELRIPEVLGVVLLCLVIVVPFLLVAHARDERLRREREAVRRQCDHSIKKPYHTGRIKEARKPPSADGT